MFNVLRKREHRMEESNNQKIAEAEAQIEKLKEDMQLLTARLAKTSEDLKTEKTAHAKTEKAFEKTILDLKETHCKEQAAEERSAALEKEVEAKNLQTEELFHQLKSSEAKSEELSAALCLSQMKTSKVDSRDENLYEEAKQVSKKIEEMTSNLGSKAKKMAFAEGDALGAMKWCSSTMDVLPKIVRAFGGFCCSAGARCLAASLEQNQCSHVCLAGQSMPLCSSKDLKDMTPVVDSVGKRIFSLCWKEGWVEDVVRDQIVALRLQVKYIGNCFFIVFEFCIFEVFYNSNIYLV